MRAIIAKRRDVLVRPDNQKTRLLRSLNGDGRYGVGLALALLVLLLPLLGGDDLRLALRYERAAILEGQWWRLLGGHLVHLDASHATLNCAGLVLLWCLFARAYRPLHWVLILLCAVLVIDAGFWWREPQLDWYVGASGVLHGICAAGCVALMREKDPVGVVAGVIFAAKLAWEHWQGPLPFEDSGPVITAAHWYGAIGGTLSGALAALAGRGRGQPLY